MANAGILIPVIRYPLSVSVIRIFGSVNLGYSNYYINTEATSLNRLFLVATKVSCYYTNEVAMIWKDDITYISSDEIV